MVDKNMQHIPGLRSFAYRQKAAEKLRANPELLNQTYETLYHWVNKDDEHAQLWALKWMELIEDLNAEAVADLITKEDDEFDFYRKSSPFACLLTQEERMELLINISTIMSRGKYDRSHCGATNFKNMDFIFFGVSLLPPVH